MLWHDLCIEINNVSEQIVYSDEQTMIESMENMDVNDNTQDNYFNIEDIDCNKFIPINQMFKIVVEPKNNYSSMYETVSIYNEFGSSLKNGILKQGDIPIDTKVIRILGYIKNSEKILCIYANLN